MKNIILTFLLSLLAFASIAQTNPTVTNAAVSPDPIPGNQPYATLEFLFANLGPDPISHLDVDAFPDPIVLTISLQNGTYDDVNFADPIAAISGSYANYFDWVYNPITATYSGTQNQPIAGFDGGNISIGYKATIATPQATPNNGFTVNLTSNGNAPNGPGTNDTNDDNTAGTTYIDGPLPVTLTAFTLSLEGQTALLNWATTEETNSDHFDIEHSVTGKEWAKVGEVASHGESQVERKYDFTHASPVNGENLYRLKMVDKDQTFAYSRIRNVQFLGLEENDLSVYPNPVSDVLKIRDYSQITKVSINDLNGRTILESGKTTTGEINVRNLTAGMYLVRIIRSNGLTSTQKVVIGK
ncbi:T9SS type A sorting domain-containing protein [Dyadobacter tibetensis]|uniref:T9SS type A sorting domain-containing protein n=1 Tax=Dyadobacter tibetensis TaxID=1211851 RepID=UPI00046EA828|nr:T9SS type A sorting domain-containing protein [Dyadobacter tibetensis]